MTAAVHGGDDRHRLTAAHLLDEPGHHRQQRRHRGGGQYFEIGREPDRVLASKIITGIRRRIPVTQEDESTEELYWRFLFAAAVALGGGSLVLSRRVELSWFAAAALVAFLVIANTMR